MCTLVQRTDAHCCHADSVKTSTLTRARVIQLWFAGVTLIIVACIAFDVASTLAAIVTLLVVSLVPPIILWMLWPGVQAPTAHDVLHGARQGTRD